MSLAYSVPVVLLALVSFFDIAIRCIVPGIHRPILVGASTIASIALLCLTINHWIRSLLVATNMLWIVEYTNQCGSRLPVSMLSCGLGIGLVAKFMLLARRAL